MATLFQKYDLLSVDSTPGDLSRQTGRLSKTVAHSEIPQAEGLIEFRDFSNLYRLKP
jgi:hypothetical protein